MGSEPAGLRITFNPDQLTLAERHELRRGNRIQMTPPKGVPYPGGESKRVGRRTWWEVVRIRQRHDDKPVTIWLRKCP
jgi:hypothetical protein